MKNNYKFHYFIYFILIYIHIIKNTFKSIFNFVSEASILKEDYFKDYMYSDLSENVSDIINLLENNYNLSSQFINQNKASIEYILNDYNFVQVL